MVALKKTMALLTVVLIAAFVWVGNANAVRQPDAGHGGSGNQPPEYGDLFILYRDADGVPILDANLCQQPLASPDLLSCAACATTPGGELLLPLDPDTCAVQLDYAMYTQEVDFGRINEARSPDTVFEAQLEDATIKLATAGCLSLDPAGRLVASSLVDGEVVSSTIDSPLQNLAIYRQLILDGSLGDAVGLPDGGDWLSTAARAFGAAADKAGKVGVDMIVYLNQIMGLTDEGVTTALGKPICIQVREEVKGYVDTVTRCYLDYSGYGYDRAANFGHLPSPPYIPATEPVDGWFEYLGDLNTNPPTFGIVQEAVLDAVPELSLDSGLTLASIAGFAQAADDTRAVIEFMHTWPVPGDYATAVPCNAGAPEYYDVSISADSGLQVPVRMVAGTEGREGTLAVYNDGPATATGSVTLSGVYVGADGREHLVRMVRLDADGLPTTEPIFDQPEAFTLPAGYSRSWAFFFSMTEATRIDWTATAEAPNDVNADNNSVAETTTVTRPHGGGGGDH